MTPTTPHNPNEALEAFNRLTYYLVAEVAPDGYSSDDADLDCKAVLQALTRPPLDLAGFKLSEKMYDLNQHTEQWTTTQQAMGWNACLDHLAAIRPDLFGGK